MRHLSLLVTGCGYFTRHLLLRLLQCARYGRLCVFSRDEWKQAQLREDLGNDPRCRWFVGDVRDATRLARAMHGVDHVIHGAALKRIETAAYNPGELAKTNVMGTLNVVEACQAAGVKQAVLLSTDKAYQPVSAYGQSKALAESLFTAANNTGGEGGTIFSIVRYGNVMGSTGSVIPLWRKQRLNGGVRVTDLEATRFWMHVDEAVDLVLRTLQKHEPGLTLPAELPGFRLADLLEAMQIEEFKVVGLPVWEKKDESLALGMCSSDARRMGVQELRKELERVS